jgi:hypothetical protein
MRFVLSLCLVLAAATSHAAWPDGNWKIDAEESKRERYLGRDSLLLRNGEVWLDDAGFQDGVIEFDLAAPPTQGFHGLAFRARDRENYEHVYVRPHQSGNPDATQYTPVFNNVSGWQIYTGPRYSLPLTIASERWVHVRVVVRGRRMELSVDGETVVFPEMINAPIAGGVAITSGNSPARFANVVVHKGELPPPEGGAGAELPALPAGIVREWRVSTAFAESAVASVAPLNQQEWRSLQWTTLPAEPNGIANLARAAKRTPEANTVFAAVTLRAGQARTIRAKFGFSDRVVAYLNGRPLFRADDKYRSRDYRFLGSMGLFDELILPLNRGDNQVWLAVSEDFGGWGAMMQLLGAEGVEVLER